MACLIISSSFSPHLTLTHTSQPPRPLFNCPYIPNSPSVRFSGELVRRKIRGLSVVTRGVPGPSTFVFAFVFPLSLLAVTIFTSVRIADKLDRDFLQELAVNQAILEAAEEEDGVTISLEEEPARPRTRNRPKREAEPSSL